MAMSLSLVMVLYSIVPPYLVLLLQVFSGLINGTRLEDLSLTNVETEFSHLSRQGTLVFNNIYVENNDTSVQCRATLSNGETVNSNNSTLLVQGEREIEI